jgi:hypothetical protein
MKVRRIYGGMSEIMKELTARTMRNVRRSRGELPAEWKNYTSAI